MWFVENRKYTRRFDTYRETTQELIINDQLENTFWLENPIQHEIYIEHTRQHEIWREQDFWHLARGEYFSNQLIDAPC